jgi:PST family polysaccharide transporter
MISKFATATQRLSPNLRKILGNTSWLFADKMLRMGISLFVGVWVARFLGPEQFGLYNYAIAFVALFNTFARLGLDQIVIRNIVRDPSRKDEMLGTAFGLKLAGGLLAVGFAVIAMLLSRPESSLTQLLVAIVAMGMVFQSFDVIDFWFQSQVESKHVVIAKNTAFVLNNLGKLILIQLQASVVWFTVMYAAEFIMGAIGLVLVYRNRGNLLQAWRFCRKTAISLLKDSWTLIISGFVIMIYMKIDQIMLGQMIGNEAVGIYSVAVKLSELWYFVPMAIVHSVFPSVVEARQTNENLYYQRIQKLLNALVFMSYIVAVFVSIVGPYAISTLFGQEFAEAGPILVVHVWAGVFVSIGLVRSMWTTTENLMHFALVSTSTGAVINIILNSLLIRDYAGMGAAIATVISQAFACYIANSFFAKPRKMFLLQTKALFTPNPMILFDIKRKTRKDSK